MDHLEPYRIAAKEYGGTFYATLWRSKEGQQLRFNAMCHAIDFTGTSILDVGCGLGDFADFLLARQISFSSFHGIDAMELMITEAEQKSLPRCSFSIGNVVKQNDMLRGFDWITMSGTLNAMPQSVAMELVSNAFEASTTGIAYNFLSNQCKPNLNEDLKPASRFETQEMLQQAFQLTRNVTFDQSYLDGHDATIILKKVQE